MATSREKWSFSSTYVLVEFLPEGLPAGGAVAQQLQRPLRQAHSSHAVVQPAGAQTTLGDLKAAALTWKESHVNSL